MIESPYVEDWIVRGMHRPESPQSLGGSQLVVDLPAVMEMISLVTQGHVTGQQLQQALDVFARRFATADGPGGYADRAGGPMDGSIGRGDRFGGSMDGSIGRADRAVGYTDGSARFMDPPGGYPDSLGGYADPVSSYADTVSGFVYPPGGYPDPPGVAYPDPPAVAHPDPPSVAQPEPPRFSRSADDTIGDGCPYGCPVCAGARAEFDAIAAESLTHKVRLSDPEHYPYAAGKHTLHLSSCPKVARFVGRVEPVGSPFCLAGLPAFAHHGVFSTAWAAGMQVMTPEEAAEWVRRQGESREGTGYKACPHCLPPVPGTEAGTDNSFDIGYWSTEDVVTWG